MASRETQHCACEGACQPTSSRPAHTGATRELNRIQPPRTCAQSPNRQVHANRSRAARCVLGVRVSEAESCASGARRRRASPAASGSGQDPRTSGRCSPDRDDADAPKRRQVGAQTRPHWGRNADMGPVGCRHRAAKLRRRRDRLDTVRTWPLTRHHASTPDRSQESTELQSR